MKRTRREAGIALIVVLWTVALLSLLVGALSRSAHVDSLSARLHAGGIQARAVAESGIWATLSTIVSSESDIPLRYTFELGGGTAAVQVEPAAARINLNAVDATTLAALLDESPLADDERRAVVARIEDWRDGDSQRQDGRVERSDYKSASSGPKNSAFYTVDELRHVAGIDEATFRRLAPFLTVFGAESGPDLRFASPELTRVLDAVPPAGAEAEPTASLPSVGVMSVHAIGAIGDARADVVAVVYLTGRPQEPYEILSWHGAVPGELEN